MKKKCILFATMLGCFHWGWGQTYEIQKLYEKQEWDKILTTAPTLDMITGRECGLVSQIYEKRGDRSNQVRWNRLAINLNSDGYETVYFRDMVAGGASPDYSKGGLIALESSKLAPESAFYYYKCDAFASQLSDEAQVMLLRKALAGHRNQKILNALMLTLKMKGAQSELLQVGQEHIAFLQKQNAVETHFTYISVMRQMVDACLEARDTIKAMELCQQVLEKRSENVAWFLTQKLSFHLQRGQFQQAEAIFQNANAKYRKLTDFVDASDDALNHIWYAAAAAYYNEHRIYRLTKVDTSNRFLYYTKISTKRPGTTDRYAALLTVEKQSNNTVNVCLTQCLTYYECQTDKQILENLPLKDVSFEDFNGILLKWRDKFK